MALASMLAILVGAMMILAGVAKLGFVADLLSKPTQIGYMTGLALTILVGQLPKLFGFSIHSDTLIGDITGFVNGVRSGETVTAAVLIGLFGLAVIVVLQRWLPKIPGVLVAVVLSIGATVVFDLAGHGVSSGGHPSPGAAPVHDSGCLASDFGLLVAGALGISLVALTDTISTASAFAARSGDEVQANQEMIGIGTSNVAAGLFQGFPVSTSGSRTAVADQSGAKTQVTGLVGAGLIVLMLLVIPGLFRNLPQPTLAAVVMAAALSLADIAGLKRLWEVRRTEFALSYGCFPRSSPPGRTTRDRHCCGALHPQRVPPIVVALQHELWDVSRGFPVITTCAPIRTPNRSTASSSSGSMPLCSLPTPEPFASRYGSWPWLNRSLAGSWWLRSPSPTSTQRQRTCSRTSMRPSTSKGSPWCSPR